MHVLIITDLEGVSCVDSIDMINEPSEGYRHACEYLMADTNAAVDGAFLGGATRVTVVDGHGSGRNFIHELLDPRAEVLLSGEFAHTTPMKYDALLCVGAHAMSGTQDAFLDHTQNSTKWFEYCINGTPQGEMGQQAYCVGHFGTPLVMTSGDEAACLEAKRLVPNIATACVKKADGRNKAICLPLKEACERIREAANDGVKRCKEIKPLRLKLPAELKLTFTRNDYCDESMHEGLIRNGRTVTKPLKILSCYRDLVKF